MNDSAPSSWQHWKRVGNEQYQQGNLDDALQSYRRSLLDPSLSDNIDKSVILSNMVACRLSLGGPAHARAAVQDAELCVQCHPTWSKAYWRLGSALSATGDSNAACNALQTCLRLDPSCSAARQLLVQDLRRETTNRRGSVSEPIEESVNDHTQTRPPPQNPSYRESPQQSTTTENNHGRQQQPQQPVTVDIDLDEELSFSDRVWRTINHSCQKLVGFYALLSDTGKSLVHIGLVLVLLYVAFGGRFGLGSTQQPARRYGHYNDHYNPYAAHGRQPQPQPTHSYDYDPYQYSPRSSSSSSYSSRPRPRDDDYTYTRTRSTSRGSWWNWWGSSTTSHHAHSGNSSSIISLSYLFGAGMVYYIYRQHGFYAAAMVVMNHFRCGGMQGHRWRGGGMYGGRRARGRGW